MKLILRTFLLLLLNIQGVWAQKSNLQDCTPFTLTIHIVNRDTGKVMLSYTDCANPEGYRIAVLKNGKATFTGKINRAEEALLFTDIYMKNLDDLSVVRFVMEPASMSLSCSIQNSEAVKIDIKGSETQKEKDKWDLNNLPHLQLQNKLYADYKIFIKKEKDNLKVEKEEKILEHKLDSVLEILAKNAASYIKSNPSSYLSGYLLYSKKSRMPLDSAKSYYISLSDKVKQSSIGNSILYDLNGLLASGDDWDFRKEIFDSVSYNQLKNAKNIHDIYLTDLAGKRTNLSRFKGKYLFLNFWASWCGPCIEHIPSLNSIIKNAENIPIKFVSISVDRNSNQWKKTVSEHDLLGVNLFDPKGILRAFYRINTFPTYIIISPDGNISNRYAPYPGSADLDSLIKTIAENK